MKLTDPYYLGCHLTEGNPLLTGAAKQRQLQLESYVISSRAVLYTAVVDWRACADHCVSHVYAYYKVSDEAACCWGGYSAQGYWYVQCCLHMHVVCCCCQRCYIALSTWHVTSWENTLAIFIGLDLKGSPACQTVTVKFYSRCLANASVRIPSFLWVWVVSPVQVVLCR